MSRCRDVAKRGWEIETVPIVIGRIVRAEEYSGQCLHGGRIGALGSTDYVRSPPSWAIGDVRSLLGTRTYRSSAAPIIGTGTIALERLGPLLIWAALHWHSLAAFDPRRDVFQRPDRIADPCSHCRS